MEVVRNGALCGRGAPGQWWPLAAQRMRFPSLPSQPLVNCRAESFEVSTIRLLPGDHPGPPYCSLHAVLRCLDAGALLDRVGSPIVGSRYRKHSVEHGGRLSPVTKRRKIDLATRAHHTDYQRLRPAALRKPQRCGARFAGWAPRNGTSYQKTVRYKAVTGISSSSRHPLSSHPSRTRRSHSAW